MSTELRRTAALSVIAVLIAVGLALGVLYSPLGNEASTSQIAQNSSSASQVTTTSGNGSSLSSTVVSELSSTATTTTNCDAPDTLCGPYVSFIITSLTSASTLGGNDSLFAGILECTHANLPPASSIEFRWITPNPINGGYLVNTSVTYTHIATIAPVWHLNSEGKYDSMFAFVLPESSFTVIHGMNYTIGISANWNSGPLKASDPGDEEGVTLPAQ